MDAAAAVRGLLDAVSTPRLKHDRRRRSINAISASYHRPVVHVDGCGRHWRGPDHGCVRRSNSDRFQCLEGNLSAIHLADVAEVPGRAGRVDEGGDGAAALALSRLRPESLSNL